MPELAGRPLQTLKSRLVVLFLILAFCFIFFCSEGIKERKKGNLFTTFLSFFLSFFLIHT